MGHNSDRLKELFWDNYKEGVGNANTSGKPVLYLDPSRIPGWDAKTLKDKIKKDSSGVYSFNLTLSERAFLVARVRDQLEEQMPGITHGVDEGILLVLLQNSLVSGPFSSHRAIPDICIINHQKDGEIDPDNILGTFGIDKFFKKEHLLPLSGTVADWRRLVGEHEGEHCNQQHIELNGDHGHLGVLKGEILSDRRAIKTLREEGKHDIVQALIDIRVLAAANGSTTHATSIFLENDASFEVTEAIYKGANNFVYDMARAVSQKLNIPLDEAIELRTEDPQRFATLVEKSLKEGRIPVGGSMPIARKRELVAAEMGLSIDEFYELDASRCKEVAETYDRLNASGSFYVPRPEDPYIKQYAEHYVAAVRRRFVSDTAPATTAKLETPPDPDLSSEEEIVGMLSDAEKEMAAKDQMEGIVFDLIRRDLGLSPDADLPDLQKCLEVLEKAIERDDHRLSLVDYRRPQQDREVLLSRSLGISHAELQRMSSIDIDKYIMLSALSDRNSNMASFKHENPYLREKIENYVSDLRVLVEALRQDSQETTELDGDRYEHRLSEYRQNADTVGVLLQSSQEEQVIAQKQGDPALKGEREDERRAHSVPTNIPNYPASTYAFS